MSDEEEIRHVLAVYVQRTDDGDAAVKSELYAEDAIYLPTTGSFVGRKAIFDELARRQSARPADRRTKTCAAIRLLPSTATRPRPPRTMSSINAPETSRGRSLSS